MNTFDDIYILDLHGNAKRKETAPDGSLDKNVFDIQQGVAIIVAIKKQKTSKKKPLARIYHADLWGSREKKYKALEKDTLKTVPYSKLDTREPFYFFIPQNYDARAEYDAGMPLDDLFLLKVTGIVTSRDDFVIDFEKKPLIDRIKDFCDKSLDTERFQQKYKLKENYQWKCAEQRNLIADYNESFLQKITYRPFDDRHIYYHTNLVFRTRENVLRNLITGNNIGLVVCRQSLDKNWCHSFISKGLTDDSFVSNRSRERGYVMPLWIYDDVLNKGPNFDEKIYKAVQKTVPDVTPESLFDYIYAVLHSRTYRVRYAEFLKSDFPRITYPKDEETFLELAKLGAELREIHLLESEKLNNLITTYPVDGNHEVKKPRFEDGKVWINELQYFGKVPEVAWNFYIGGYQPAQKWLKDRKGRNLTIDDIKHWQRIIVALTETDRIMKQIDKIKFLPKPESN